MFTWPSTLPHPNNDLTAETKGAVIRTKLEGPRTVRERFESETQTMSVAWNMTDEQYQLFRTVYYFELSSGTEWFNVELPLGDGLTTTVAKFASDGFSAQNRGVLNWRVAAQLELRDNDQVMTHAELLSLLP